MTTGCRFVGGFGHPLSFVGSVRFQQAAFGAAKDANPERFFAVGLDGAEKTELWRSGDPGGDAFRTLGLGSHKPFLYFAAAFGTLGWGYHCKLGRRATLGTPLCHCVRFTAVKILQASTFVQQLLVHFRPCGVGSNDRKAPNIPTDASIAGHRIHLIQNQRYRKLSS